MLRIVLISVALVACGVGILALLSCRREPASAQAARPEPDAVYTVRGRVLMLPEAGKPMSDLQIHHEPIDTLVNPNGTVGMPAMIMPFPVAKGVSLEGLAVGDAVEFTFAHWTKPGQRGYEVTTIRKLPADTALDLPE
ncbi:MAG: copper-binding protein [Phycisphaeraceae bacterium]|nr:copper-binding protein [Phycisphaeraceae bacterium]MBX3407319.1 copper-binding protein [Phycisphaeraceae bacterium]